MMKDKKDDDKFGFFSDFYIKNSNSNEEFKGYQKKLDNLKNDNFFKSYNVAKEYDGYECILDNNPIRTNLTQTIDYFHEFCEKTDLAKVTFIDQFISMRDLKVIDDVTFNNALDKLIPECKFDIITGVFIMELNFMPYLKFKSLKDFVKVKNTLIYLIQEGIRRMQYKPRFNEEPVLIIFTMHSKFLFDLDNVEIKYIIDAMRYSHFFADDSYNYVSILIEGVQTKEPPFINVKVAKKRGTKITI